MTTRWLLLLLLLGAGCADDAASPHDAGHQRDDGDAGQAPDSADVANLDPCPAVRPLSDLCEADADSVRRALMMSACPASPADVIERTCPVPMNVDPLRAQRSQQRNSCGGSTLSVSRGYGATSFVFGANDELVGIVQVGDSGGACRRADGTQGSESESIYGKACEPSGTGAPLCVTPAGGEDGGGL